MKYSIQYGAVVGPDRGYRRWLTVVLRRVHRALVNRREYRRERRYACTIRI